MSQDPDKVPSSRRSFLRGFASRPVQIIQGVADKTIEAEREKSGVKEVVQTPVAPKYQFALAGLMGLMTLLCVWLGLLSTGDDAIVFLGSAVIALATEFIRGQYRPASEITIRKYATAWANAIGGAFMGVFFGDLAGRVATMSITPPLSKDTIMRITISLGLIVGSVAFRRDRQVS